MKNKSLKQIFWILIVLNSFINVVSANQKKENIHFSLTYLFQKGYGEQAIYSIYNEEQLLTNLDCLKGRNILEIRFDKENKNSILFAEKIDNLYRVVKLDYIKNEETILFEFEQQIYSFSAFTENSFFWCERCEKSPEPHILYEYDSSTKKIKKLYEVEDIRRSPEYSYEHRYITSVLVNDNYIYFYMNGGFIGDSGSYVINRSTGEVRKHEIDLGWSHPNSRFKNKIIREGSSVTQSEKIRYWESNGRSCVIFDLISFEEIQCTFKKRYERMAGPLILLSDDYFLVPLCIRPIRDSWNNGLFGNNWTVCYTVFDIKKNRAVFNGIVSETNKMHIVDAMLIN